MAAADSSTWLPTSFCGKKRRRVSDEGDSSMQPHSPVPVGRPLVQPISPTGAASSSATSRGGQNKATSALEESRPAGLPSGAGATASEHNIDIQHSRTLSRAALKSIRLTRPQTVEQLVIQKNTSLRDIVRDRDPQEPGEASEPRPEDQVDEELAQLAEILALSKQEFESREFRLGESHDVLVAKLFAYGLRERDVEGDGNCQFRALSDQLYGTEKHHATVRTKVVTQLERGGEFYKHFVAGVTSFTSSTTRGTTTTSASAPASNDPDDVFSLYLVRMSEDKEWGDHVTLQAAADAYDCEIRLVTSYDEDAVVTISPLQYGNRSDDGQRGPGRRPVLWLAFWAEVHYNSLEDDPEGEGQ
eukprot:g20624.t1